MFVIVGKIRDAKKGNQRMSKKIDQVLSNLNSKYSSDLAEPLKRINQISFEGVLEKGIYVFEMVDKLKFGLSDFDMAFGIGFCEPQHKSADRSTIIESGKVNAHHALELLEEKNDYGNAHIQISLGKQNSLENLVNAAIRTTDFIESRWRQSQYELVRYLVLTYGFMENFIQKDVAKTLKLSPQNFNQQLKNSGYFNILRLKREMTVVLEQYRRAAYQAR